MVVDFKLCALMVAILVFNNSTIAAKPPALEQRQDLETAVQSAPEMTAKEIITRAYEAAGGESWVRPQSLKLSGYNIIRREDGEVLWDRYTMWREYAGSKDAAHEANGKVRIEAWRGDKLAMLISFDGSNTYNQDGKLPDQSRNSVWKNSFGFGAIRHALDPGWQQKRLPDDLIDGKPAYLVELTDPSGSSSLFGIRQADSAVVYVGFNTPRGWHEKKVLRFSSASRGPAGVNRDESRLFYNGVKANEAIWQDFELGKSWDKDLFTNPVPKLASSSDETD